MAPQVDGSAGLAGDDDFFISLALDPDPAPGPSPMTKNQQFQDQPKHALEEDPQTRDYINKGSRMPSTSSHREVLRENGRESSRSSSMDRTKRAPPSPHIAYQQKGRQPSSEYSEVRPRKDISDVSPAFNERNLHSQSSSTYTSQATSPAEFKLQDAPKSRKGSVSRKLSKTNPRAVHPPAEPRNQDVEAPIAASPTSDASPMPQMDGRQVERPARGDSLERPARGDSLGPSSHRQALSRKDIGSSGPTTPTMSSQPTHERNISAASVPRMSHDEPVSRSMLNGGSAISRPNESSISKSILDVPSLPARSTSRPTPLGSAGEVFTAPRPPPPPPGHKTSESIASIASNSSLQRSPTLPKHTAGENFSMEEEMSRILKGEQIDDKDTNVLRRVSNAAKHMRSFSDRSGATPKTHKFVRSPSVTNGSIEISSPTTASPDMKDDNIMLRSKLRRAQQRIAELEAEKHGLEDIVNSSQDIQKVDTALREKRSTMAFLDTQREIVVRELEVMTEHLKKAKESSQPLDINALKSDILRDFGGSLLRLKDQLAGEIEELIHRRNELTNEIGDIIQMKDKGIQEYEDLTSRNHQLNDLNNSLIFKIRELHEKNKGGLPPPRPGFNGMGTPISEFRTASSSTVTSPNGLGIYTHHSKDSSIMTSIDPSRANSNDPSLQNLINEDAEPAVMTAPHVVNIRKGRPNMWKKGAQAVGKNFKGIKGAFAGANQYPDRSGGYGSQTQTLTEGVPYGSLPVSNDSLPTISGPMNVRKGDGMQNFWAAGQKGGKGPLKGQTLGMGMPNGSGTNVANAEDCKFKTISSLPDVVTNSITALFGSDLAARCKYEGLEIPSIVHRCIEEVEVRGMDIEGVYRKSGGSGQVNTVRSGFEKDPNYDISDPDLDIHAVTSALKQYFRRLPMPLITYDVYDMLLDAVRMEDPEKRIMGLKASIQALPKAHQDVLSFLIFHLVRVMGHESSNLVKLSLPCVPFALSQC